MGIVFFIILIITCVICRIFFKMHSMNNLEKVWIILTTLFVKWFFTLNIKNKIILLCFVLSINWIRGPLFFTLCLPIIVFSGNYELTKLSTSFLFYTCFDVKFSGYSLPNKPTIFLCNYPANFIEYLTNNLLNNKLCILVWGGVTISKIVGRFYGKNGIIIVSKGGSFEKTQVQIQERIKNGYSIVAFIEKDYWKRPNIYALADIRSGIFSIAKNINSTITPVIIDHIEHNIGIISNSNFQIYVDKTRIVDNIDAEIKNVTRLFKRKLRLFKIK
jgi:hypothetical protein